MHQNNSHADQHDSTVPSLTGLAIGRGALPDAGVGRSSPLPNPLSEKGAASADRVNTANSSTSRTQLKGPSAALVATGRNTSWPPDNVPTSHAIVSNKGAWFSTFGAQRGAYLLSPGRHKAPPHNQIGASMTSSGKPEVLSHSQQHGGTPSASAETLRLQRDPRRGGLAVVR